MITASAPGKLVLCGEYAVLDGHPAVVAAVDVRAVARFTDEPNAPLMQAVVDAAWTHGFQPEHGVVVDTSAFLVGGRKLGVGSSAAAATAAAALLVDLAYGKVEVDLVWRIARDAHQAFQGGGSGIDVAASTFGGLLRFSLEAAPVPAPPLPRELEVLVVDTGSATATQGFVDRVLALPDRAKRLAPIAAAAAAFLAACERDDANALVAAVEHACEGMRALGLAAGVDIVSAPHTRVAWLASAHGGAAKPSGAGGGDVAVAFVPRERAAALRAALAAAALPVVDVRLGAEGARIDP